MGYKDTRIYFLEESCTDILGSEKGERIYRQSEERLEKLISEARFVDNQKIVEHMKRNLLPVIAFYQVLQENNQRNAFELANKVEQRAAHQD